MIELLLEPHDLARIRFARSPMHELMGQHADRPSRRPDPNAPAMGSLGASAVADLRLEFLRPPLAGTRYVPEFPCPSPHRMNTRFADELAQVRSTPEADVCAQLDLLRGSASLPEALIPLYENPERHLGQVAYPCTTTALREYRVVQTKRQAYFAC